MNEPLKLIVMGVAGAGKSTVGLAVAKALRATYFDGDDFHPRANIQKMSEGIPLNDEDRAPWLRTVGETLAKANEPTLVGCSALKRRYRDLIRELAGERILFLFLSGSPEIIKERMAGRLGHYMPLSLLDSQFRDLEPPEIDENAVIVDVDQPLDHLVDEIVEILSPNR
ncbi:MAG: gluconokinase [Albidovulum sp.]|nr:gluconokinase [Albidovulum sp.]MDE0306671.1 gluconokinase [Albidovulum sp.]MDE0532683.1 gluconokinase [Albidovulum sp.]